LVGQHRRPSGPGAIPGGQWSADAAGGAGGGATGAAGFAGTAGAGTGGALGTTCGGAAATQRPSALRVSPVGQGGGGDGDGGAQPPPGDSTSPGMQRALRSSSLLPGQARRSFGFTGCEQHSPVDVRLALAQHWPAPEGT
jgi:hypothetical protein